MMLLNKGTKIAIWGTGLYARKLYKLECKKYEVVCFYDNDKEKWGQKLYGIPVKQWNNQDKIKIIIASSYWEEILKELLGQGLRLLDDVIPFHFLHCRSIEYDVLKKASGGVKNILFLIQKLKASKKIAVIYGNCQTGMLRKILMFNPYFVNKFFFIVIPAICDYNAGEEMRKLWRTLLAHDEFWKEIDLFLCQKVSESNRFCSDLATDNLVRKLSSKCQVITIMNIFFDGYFIQRTENRNNIMKEIHQSGLFPFGDMFVDELIKKGFKEEEILEQIQDENFIAPEVIDQAVNQSLSELKRREKEADVVISDYIELGYRERQLFYSPNHPVNTVLIEYARRIIRYMGLPDSEIKEDIVYMKAGCLKGQDTPVYPSVIKTLNLRDYDNCYYSNRYLESDFLFGFEEYIRKYIWYCHR